MPAMPSMKSLMFKEEEFTVGFWPGCQAPDLKEVPNFSAIFSSLLDKTCHDYQGALLERWHRLHLRLGKLSWKVRPPLVPGIFHDGKLFSDLLLFQPVDFGYIGPTELELLDSLHPECEVLLILPMYHL